MCVCVCQGVCEGVCVCEGGCVRVCEGACVKWARACSAEEDCVEGLSLKFSIVMIIAIYDLHDNNNRSFPV